MRTRRKSAAFTTLAIVAVACGSVTAPPNIRGVPDAVLARSTGEGAEASRRAHLDLRVERASLVDAAEALSDAIERKRIVAALRAALAEDALFLSPRMPSIRGADAIENFLATNPIAPSAMRWDVIKADVSSDGTHGFTWMQGFFTINLGAGATETPGLFLTYWRRTAGGDWRVAVLVFNVRAPAPQRVPEGFGTPATKHRRYFPKTGVDEQRAAVMAADAAFSAMSVSDGTGPAFAAFAAPDAMASAGGTLVFGPAAIGAAFTFGPGDVVSWAPRYADAAATGDLGFTVGDATFALASGTNFYSKYLTVWQKQDTGEWKYVADLGSSRPASP